MTRTLSWLANTALAQPPRDGRLGLFARGTDGTLGQGRDVWAPPYPQMGQTTLKASYGRQRMQGYQTNHFYSLGADYALSSAPRSMPAWGAKSY